VGIFSSLCSFSISQLLLAEWNYKIPPSLESSSYIFSLVIFFCLCEFFPPSLFLSFLTHSLYIYALPLYVPVFLHAPWLFCMALFARARVALSLYCCVPGTCIILNFACTPSTTYYYHRQLFISPGRISGCKLGVYSVRHAAHLLVLICYENELICTNTHSHIHKKPWRQRVYLYR
jgi:hypothetical protein